MGAIDLAGKKQVLRIQKLLIGNPVILILLLPLTKFVESVMSVNLERKSNVSRVHSSVNASEKFRILIYTS